MLALYAALQDANATDQYPWLRNWRPPFSDIPFAAGELHPIGEMQADAAAPHLKIQCRLLSSTALLLQAAVAAAEVLPHLVCYSTPSCTKCMCVSNLTLPCQSSYCPMQHAALSSVPPMPPHAGDEELWSLGQRLRSRFPTLTRAPYFPKRYPIISTQVRGPCHTCAQPAAALHAVIHAARSSTSDLIMLACRRIRTLMALSSPYPQQASHTKAISCT